MVCVGLQCSGMTSRRKFLGGSGTPLAPPLLLGRSHFQSDGLNDSMHHATPYLPYFKCISLAYSSLVSSLFKSRTIVGPVQIFADS